MLKLFNAVDKAKNRAKAKAMRQMTKRVEAIQFVKKLKSKLGPVSEKVVILNTWDNAAQKWTK